MGNKSPQILLNFAPFNPGLNSSAPSASGQALWATGEPLNSSGAHVLEMSKLQPSSLQVRRRWISRPGLRTPGSVALELEYDLADPAEVHRALEDARGRPGHFYYWLGPLLAASACCIFFVISSFTASRLKLAPFCIGGYSRKVWSSLPITCWTKTKRQN
jgi:hypothetical protein